jgi:hypothetical protein
MVVSHDRTPIRHCTTGIILQDLIESLERAHIPKVVQQSEHSVEIRGDGWRARNIYVNLAKALIGSRTWMLKMIVLSKNRDCQQAGGEQQKEVRLHGNVYR